MKSQRVILVIYLFGMLLNAASHSKLKYQFPPVEYLLSAPLLQDFGENYFLEKTELCQKIAEKKLSQKKLEKIVDKAIESFCKKYNDPLLPFDIKTNWKNKRVQLINTLIQCATFSYCS